MDIQSLLDTASIQFYPPKSDIISTKCKQLGLGPSQGICILLDSLNKLHLQLRNRSQLCKESKFLMPMDIQSLLGMDRK